MASVHRGFNVERDDNTSTPPSPPTLSQLRQYASDAFSVNNPDMALEHSVAMLRIAAEQRNSVHIANALNNIASCFTQHVQEKNIAVLMQDEERKVQLARMLREVFMAERIEDASLASPESLRVLLERCALRLYEDADQIMTGKNPSSPTERGVWVNAKLGIIHMITDDRADAVIPADLTRAADIAKQARDLCEDGVDTDTYHLQQVFMAEADIEEVVARDAMRQGDRPTTGTHASASLERYLQAALLQIDSSATHNRVCPEMDTGRLDDTVAARRGICWERIAGLMDEFGAHGLRCDTLHASDTFRRLSRLYALSSSDRHKVNPAMAELVYGREAVIGITQAELRGNGTPGTAID